MGVSSNCFLEIVLRFNLFCKLLKDNTELPVAAYNVSGEYAMIKAAVQKGWLNDQRATTEVLTSIRRAGATAILTYHAKEVLENKWL